MPVSRKGRGVKRGTIAVRVGTDVLEAIQPALLGREPNATLLERWRKKRVAGSIQWERIGRGPWQASAELTRPWTAVRERAGLPNDVVAYALRHSSIVRGIRRDQPIRLVAALHDTSVAMIERHYSRYIADVDELAARSVVPLIAPCREKVVRLARR